MIDGSKELVDIIKEFLELNKVEDTIIYDFEKKDYFAAFVIVGTSHGEVHSRAVVKKLSSHLKKYGCVSRIDGVTGSKWFILETMDVILHIFDEETRKHYNLEDLLSKRR